MDKMKPVTFDGWLIVLLAMCPAAVAWICGDEAAKYISPVWIFYWKGVLSTAGVGLGALKGYRSMQFAQYKLNGGADPSHTEIKVARPGETTVTTKVTTQTNEKTQIPPTAPATP